MREMNTLSRRVHQLRRTNNLTKQALAQRSGLSVSTVERIEGPYGRFQNPHLTTVSALARGLGVKVSELTNRPAPQQQPVIFASYQ